MNDDDIIGVCVLLIGLLLCSAMIGVVVMDYDSDDGDNSSDDNINYSDEEESHVMIPVSTGDGITYVFV